MKNTNKKVSVVLTHLSYTNRGTDRNSRCRSKFKKSRYSLYGCEIATKIAEKTRLTYGPDWVCSYQKTVFKSVTKKHIGLLIIKTLNNIYLQRLTLGRLGICIPDLSRRFPGIDPILQLDDPVYQLINSSLDLSDLRLMGSLVGQDPRNEDRQ